MGDAAPADGASGTGDGGPGPQQDAQPGYDAPAPASSLVAVPLEECTPLVYTAPVVIGSQTFQLTVDTGSTTLGVASSKCTNCNVNPLYTPGATAVDQMQPASSQYGSGSWTGEVYKDSVGFMSDPMIPLNFAAITTQTNFFGPVMCHSGGSYQGILGLDRASAELPGTNAFFDQYVAAKGIANVFATELCDTSGTLWFGGYDTSVATAAPQYTPVDDRPRLVVLLHGRSRDDRGGRFERARGDRGGRLDAPRHGGRHRNDRPGRPERRVQRPDHGHRGRARIFAALRHVGDELLLAASPVRGGGRDQGAD